MAVEAGGIGTRLRAGREKLGLTVLQVAERIHTDPKIVEAIEAESFEALGAPVYARGHIRHYADLVGESANELTQMYSNLNRVAQPDLTRIVKAPARPESNKLVAPALVVIVVFAVAGAIWWVSALSKKKPQMSDSHVVTDEAPAASNAPDGSAAPEGAPAADGAASTVPPEETPRVESPSAERGAGSAAPTSSGAAAAQPRLGSNGGGGTSAGSAAMRGAAPGTSGSAAGQGEASRAASAAPPAAHAPASTSTAGQGAASRAASAVPPARTPAPTSAAVASTRAPAAASAASAPTRAGSAVAPGAAATAAVTEPARPKNQSSVTLRYSADSWTEVYDASGARLYYDVGAANSVQTVVGTPPLRVVLGNASGVSVEYNGHSKPIAKMSRPDGSVQFSITRSGEVVRAKPVADGG
jgi:cytoskeleton protein RodZ